MACQMYIFIYVERMGEGERVDEGNANVKKKINNQSVSQAIDLGGS